MYYITSETNDAVVAIDKLTYAGNLMSLAPVVQNERFAFEKVDVCDRTELARVFTGHRPDCVMHLAAESHVDRSIDDPVAFVEASIVGTYTLLEAAQAHRNTLTEDKKSAFRFHHAPTDEVYGDLHSTDDFFIETAPYAPSSPYSASKANGNRLMHAWLRTYGLPTLITNCSGNYNPYYFPEKLTPLMILNALAGKLLPVYGNGQQIRDWLYVEDHARTLYYVATTGKVGETYDISGHNGRKNFDIVETICKPLEELTPNEPRGVAYYRDLTTFVVGRLGHGLRYAIDASKIAREPGWLLQETFESEMRKMAQWYLANESWWK